MEQYKTFLPRLGALLIDSFIFLPLGIITQWLIEANVSPGVIYLWLPISSLAFPLYSIILNGLYGQTLGKMALGVKILTPEETPISFRQAVIRDIPQLVFSLTGLFYAMTSPLSALNENSAEVPLPVFLQVIYAMIAVWTLADVIVFFSNTKRRALHDYVAGTMVVKTKNNLISN